MQTPAFTICSCSSWLLASFARRRCHFISFEHLEEIKKKIKTLSSLRSKMSPEIMSNNPRLLIFQVYWNISSFNWSIGRNILKYRTSKLAKPRSRLDVMPSGRRREHAQYVTSLKIYVRPRLRAVASRILKSLISNPKNVSETYQDLIYFDTLLHYRDKDNWHVFGIFPNWLNRNLSDKVARCLLSFLL